MPRSCVISSPNCSNHVPVSFHVKVLGYPAGSACIVYLLCSSALTSGASGNLETCLDTRKAHDMKQHHEHPGDCPQNSLASTTLLVAVVTVVCLSIGQIPHRKSESVRFGFHRQDSFTHFDILWRSTIAVCTGARGRTPLATIAIGCTIPKRTSKSGGSRAWCFR